MKITFPMLSLGPSGGSRVIADLANGLQENGHNITFVVPKGADRGLYPLNVDIIETRTSLKKRGFYYFKAFIVFFEIIFLIPKSDIICATAGVTSLIVIIAAKIFRKGIPLYFVQGIDDLYLESRTDFIARFMIKRSYKWFDHLVFVSKRLMRAIGGSGKRCIVIHPGINALFTPNMKRRRVSADPPAIIWVGRKFKLKGLRDMLKAFKIILRTKKRAKLLLITPDKVDIGNSKNVSIKSLIPTQELAKAYARSDVFVSTSIFEGLCLPPLEAMASGIPVVTTDSVGVMEYAKDGINSLVVPRSDPERIAGAVLRVLNDHATGRRIVLGGKRTAKQFSWDKTINKFDRYLEGLIRDEKRKVHEG